MRRINRDSFPHLFDVFCRRVNSHYFTFLSRLTARWWGVTLGRDCSFFGRARFFRHPRSNIIIGDGCQFRSSSASNFIGVNHPCILATLDEEAQLNIGANCGFSGTSIGCALDIKLYERVRCGANTLITDSDWHTDDIRIGDNKPVVIESNVWLGVNVLVLKGVTIGENTIVAAGSVVTKSLPPKVFAGGTPAKVLREF